MTGLEVKDLCVRRGGALVVNQVSLAVRPGEIVGLIGPNGAGKSSTFQAIVGVIPALSGSISLGGKSLNHMPLFMRARQGLGYLPQDASVFEGMTVAGNIQALVEVSHAPWQRSARVSTLLNDFGLEELRNQKAETLSGGQRRKLEIARALAANPEVILLDEPFAGVDPIAVQALRDAIVAIKASGKGVLITDHNVRDTLRLVDRAVLIDRGTVLIDGKPDQILADEIARNRYLGKDFDF